MFREITEPFTPKALEQKTVLGPVPPDVALELKNLLLPNQPGWIAPLGPNIFRLLSIYWALDAAIAQIEIIESIKDKAPNHARIYFQPREDFIPTIIVGHYQSVANAAVQDGKIAVSLNGTSRSIAEDGIELTVPDDILWLPGLEQIFHANQKLMIMTRRTSFLLEKPSVARIRGKQVQVKKFSNQFAPNEFFARVESLDEESPVIEEVPNICLTNAASYVARHTSIEFQQIPS